MLRNHGDLRRIAGLSVILIHGNRRGDIGLRVGHDHRELLRCRVRVGAHHRVVEVDRPVLATDVALVARSVGAQVAAAASPARLACLLAALLHHVPPRTVGCARDHRAAGTRPVVRDASRASQQRRRAHPSAGCAVVDGSPTRGSPGHFDAALEHGRAAHLTGGATVRWWQSAVVPSCRRVERAASRRPCSREHQQDRASVQDARRVSDS